MPQIEQEKSSSRIPTSEERRISESKEVEASLDEMSVSVIS